MMPSKFKCELRSHLRVGLRDIENVACVDIQMSRIRTFSRAHGELVDRLMRAQALRYAAELMI